MVMRGQYGINPSTIGFATRIMKECLRDMFALFNNQVTEKKISEDDKLTSIYDNLQTDFHSMFDKKQ